MNKTNRIVSLVTCVALMTPSSGAYAFGVIDPSQILQNASNTGSIVSALVQQATQAAQNSLKQIAAGEKVGGQTVSAISVQTNVQTETARTIAENQEQAAVIREKQKQKTEATIAAKPAASGGCTGQLAGQGSQVISGGGKKVANAVSRVRTKRAKTSASTVAQLGSVLETHTEKYCSDGDATIGVCKAPVEKRLQDADIRAETIYSGSASTESGNDEALTLDRDGEEAAQQFAANALEGGINPPKLDRNLLETDEGKKYEALRNIYLAKTSFAKMIIGRDIGRRIGTPESEQTYRRLMADSESPSGLTGAGGYFKKMVEASGKRLSGERISEMELLKFQVGMRYANPAWFEELQKSPTESLLREIAIMQALALKMQYEEMQDRALASGMEAVRSIDDINASMMPRLNQAYGAALKSD